MNSGIDRVELVKFGTLCKAKFAAIEAHDRFWTDVAAQKNKDYLISLARKQVKFFAATRGREDENSPFLNLNLLPNELLKPLLAVDEQERQWSRRKSSSTRSGGRRMR